METGARRQDCRLFITLAFWDKDVTENVNKTHASLDAFCQKFSERISNRYLIYTKDFKKDEETTLLPVFMTIFL